MKLELRIWYDESQKRIKLAGKGLTASTVSNDPKSERYHKNLFMKLNRCLKEAGLPHQEDGD